ncbi:MAG: hypothetical protein A2Z88_09085 [Omnitrophica WOR_2 bacterium GWA2_47_8]|nr:MAG: hypothetical protein A2Z88_09085 [Omnitrophica WOR_2 bacterium GWA2_47_8]
MLQRLNKPIFILYIVFLWLSNPPILFAGESEESISQVLRDLNYPTQESEAIAEALTPLFNQLPDYRNQDENVLIKEIGDNVRLIFDDVLKQDALLNRVKIRNTYHFKIMSLLSDRESVDFIENKLSSPKDLPGETLSLLTVPFRCNYLTLVGYVLLKAKGLEPLPIHTQDKATIARNLPRSWWQEMLLILGVFEVNVGKSDSPYDPSSHILLLLKLEGDRFIEVDFTNRFISQPFSLDQNYISKANDRYILKDHEARGDLYRDIKIFTPDDLKAGLLTNLSVVFQHFVEYRKAIVLNEEAIRIKPDFMTAYINLSDIYSNNLKNTDKGYEWVLKAHLMDPNDPLINYNMGTFFGMADKYEESIPYFQRSIDVDPNMPVVYYGLAVSHFRLGQYEKSIVLLNKSIELNPDFADAHGLLEEAKDRLKNGK